MARRGHRRRKDRPRRRSGKKKTAGEVKSAEVPKPSVGSLGPIVGGPCGPDIGDDYKPEEQGPNWAS